MVDTTGSVIRGSVHVLRSTDDGFAEAATEKTSTWSFDPAVIAGTKVRQIYDFKTTDLARSGGRTGRQPTSGGISHDLASC